MAEQSTAGVHAQGALAETPEHDAWFRHEIEKAIRKADGPDAHWTDHAEVKQRFAQKRAELANATGTELKPNDDRVAG